MRDHSLSHLAKYVGEYDASSVPAVSGAFDDLERWSGCTWRLIVNVYYFHFSVVLALHLRRVPLVHSVVISARSQGVCFQIALVID